MKLIIRKRENEKNRINRWMLFSVVFFAAVIVSVFAAVHLLAASNQASSAAALNSACEAYGNSLTQEFQKNSSAIQSLNVTGLNDTVGDSFYCFYSYSCASAKPQVANSLNCMCNILQSNRVVIAGACIKQILSNG